jgi:hypothetical protein
MRYVFPLTLVVSACGSEVTVGSSSSGSASGGGTPTGVGGTASGTPVGTGGAATGTPAGTTTGLPAVCPETLGGGIAADGWTAGAYCDSLFLCAPSPVPDELYTTFPDADCGPQSECDEGQVACILQGGEVSRELYGQFCKAAEAELLESVICFVLGP